MPAAGSPVPAGELQSIPRVGEALEICEPETPLAVSGPFAPRNPEAAHGSCRPALFGAALDAVLVLAACGDTTEQRAATAAGAVVGGSIGAGAGTVEPKVSTRRSKGKRSSAVSPRSD